MRSRLTTSLFAAVLIMAACSGGGETSSDSPADEGTTTTTTVVATTTVGQDTSPDTQPPVDTTSPAAVEPPTLEFDPGWTTFTTSDGLPGNDVVTIDINADGTTWAMIALDRNPNGSPGEVTFARFQGNGWTAFPAPEPLDGEMSLAAGPAGTAWIVGGGEFLGNLGDRYTGTPGVWFFDGANWNQIETAPGPGDPVPVRAESGSDGVLWSAGMANITTSRTGVFSHDGTEWTIHDIPEHLFDCIDCHRLYLTGDGQVWIDYVDVDENFDPVAAHARLDGDTWNDFVFPDVFSVPEETAGLVFDTARRIGHDDIYVIVVVGGIVQDRPGVPLPGPGDVAPFAATTFDGNTWSQVIGGELAIADGHIVRPGIELVSPGQIPIAAVHDDGIIYLAGLGGLQLINADGSTTSLTTADGLVSNATQNVTTGPSGSVWVATDGGVSVLVDENR